MNCKKSKDLQQASKPVCVTISDDEEEDGTEIHNENIPSKHANRKSVDASSSVKDNEARKPLEPTIVRISKGALKAGVKVYSMERGLKDPWLEATIESLEMRYGRIMIHVAITQPDKGYSRRKFQTKKIVSNSHLAYFDPPDKNSLITGVRVVARTGDESYWGKYFFVGIVAEPPSSLNRHRALIFFDDGHAAYCSTNDVRLTASSVSGGLIWSECHPEMQEFIQNYIRLYPENIIKATLRKNAIATVEFNGTWWAARVLEVDCSLVKVKLVANGFEFTIWRGSDRLYDVYRRCRKNAGRGEKIQACFEYEGKIEVRRVPSYLQKLCRDHYEPHECIRSCGSVFQGVLEDLKDVSPLAIPLYHGWKREVETTSHEKSPRLKRPVVYTAPCGRKFYHLDNIQEFLTKTKSPFGIDSFDTTFLLNCMEEFSGSSIPLRIHPDFSEGKESINISMINCVDYKGFPEITYIRDRIPRPGVNINTSPEFLVCCDCVDDCQDKSKCACYQLTETNYKKSFPDSPFDDLAYKHRRLLTKCTTGIYECNSRCKCTKNCVNRVVQLGLKWKLQVFKTQSKGFGVRTLQDIPQGTFVAIFTGEILTCTQANEDGRVYGDEYLADLDFIEIAEQEMAKFKDGYEEEVVEVEPVEPKSRTGKRGGGKEISKQAIFEAPVREEGDKPKPSKTSEGGECKNSRLLFGKDEEIYVVDAKRIGNVARFINHSCNPNLFVQDVFLDSHDLRFPWISLFTLKLIKAGSELTWDYNYELKQDGSGTVPCNCLYERCRGWLR